MYPFNGGWRRKSDHSFEHFSNEKTSVWGLISACFTLFEASKGVWCEAFKTRLYEVKGYKEHNLLIASAALYHNLNKIHYSVFELYPLGSHTVTHC
jgi:hypothetical protein